MPSTSGPVFPEGDELPEGEFPVGDFPDGDFLLDGDLPSAGGLPLGEVGCSGGGRTPFAEAGEPLGDIGWDADTNCFKAAAAMSLRALCSGPLAATMAAKRASKDEILI